VDTALNAGAANTIEVARGDGDLYLNGILVSNAAGLATAGPHRAVLSLSPADRDDLLAFLRQLDGRDAIGNVLSAPISPPSFDAAPEPIHFDAGDLLSFTAPSLANFPGWIVQLESSANLQLWAPVPVPLNEQPINSEWHRHTATLPFPDGPRQYYRARLLNP
jgi:hypothetical protein